VQPPDSNPDIIDLSKPLNPSDVDRILQALLMQQARQSATTEAMPAPAQVAAPVIQQQQPQQEASQSQQNQQQSAPSAPVPPAPLSASADASFDDYLFNPSMVPQGLDDNASREWLLKSGWAQDLLGPSGS
jgi:hypothetical protein